MRLRCTRGLFLQSRAMVSSTVPMFKPFRLALIQLGGLGSSKSDNLRHAGEMILKAVQPFEGSKPNLIVLPECFNSPYGVQYFPEYAEEIGFIADKPYDVSKSPSQTVKMLSNMAKQSKTWIVGGSLPERDKTDGKLYNTATVYNPVGDLVVIHRKVHLFDIDIPGKITFKESTTLTGGSNLTHFDTEFGRIGLGICYDVRFPEMAMVAARRGCAVMIYPGAFNLTTGPMHWELLQRARAVDNQIYVATCSPARDMAAEYHAWGHSSVVSPIGDVVATTDEQESIVYADIDPTVTNATRAGIPVGTQRRFDVYKDVNEGS
ncbi:carbon-nitrogen hydrolase [Gautieria morchelliformis]|nr:carbon-nitrogen hydrolase [Gautieria morchelliformis]